jgi:hypothetical protein
LRYGKENQPNWSPSKLKPNTKGLQVNFILI